MFAMPYQQALQPKSPPGVAIGLKLHASAISRVGRVLALSDQLDLPILNAAGKAQPRVVDLIAGLLLRDHDKTDLIRGGDAALDTFLRAT